MGGPCIPKVSAESVLKVTNEKLYNLFYSSLRRLRTIKTISEFTQKRLRTTALNC